MGHKKSLKNGGSNKPRNVRPICHACNRKMSSMNMDAFIKKYYPESAPKPDPTKPVKKKRRKKRGTGLLDLLG